MGSQTSLKKYLGIGWERDCEFPPLAGELMAVVPGGGGSVSSEVQF